MQCVTPMYRLYDFNTGKTIRIVSRQEVLQGLAYNPNTIRHTLDVMNNKIRARSHKYQIIPCQHCWACQLSKSAEWATRIMLESLYHDECYFITLTYDDEHLPIATHITTKHKKVTNEKIDIEYRRFENDGTWTQGTLWPDHVSEFLHSIREYMRYNKGIEGIKYFYCGEYGTGEDTNYETTHRPHYHLILFGAKLDPECIYDTKIDENFKEHFKSTEIEKFWKHGLIDIAYLEWSDAAYVARYCTKKLYTESNSDDLYAMEGKLKEFIRMSRMPGIGKRYYEEHKDAIYKSNGIAMKTIKGKVGYQGIPKAFDRYFKEEFPEEFEKIQKKRREQMERSRTNGYHKSNYSDLEQLIMREEKLNTKGQMLKREGV